MEQARWSGIASGEFLPHRHSKTGPVLENCGPSPLRGVMVRVPVALLGYCAPAYHPSVDWHEESLQAQHQLRLRKNGCGQQALELGLLLRSVSMRCPFRYSWMHLRLQEIPALSDSVALGTAECIWKCGEGTRAPFPSTQSLASHQLMLWRRQESPPPLVSLCWACRG